MERQMTTISRQKAWQGPAVFSLGFRPFFLMAGIWAALAMVIWIFMLAGASPLPTAFDMFTWHAHEFVFGYGLAVISGFLLTEVPNWTGRLPVVGWPLAALAGAWLAGRIAIAVSLVLPAWVVAAVDLAPGLVLAVVIAREVLAGQNWRNLPVLGLFGLFLAANLLFHLEAARDGSASDEVGLRLGLAVILLLIALIGGRIVPSFTRNWLVQRGAPQLPVAFGRADGGVLALTALALAGFITLPDSLFTGALCVLAGAANLWRLARWQGVRTGAEPLLWVLHVGYLFLALGFLAVGAAVFGLVTRSGGMHLWLAGAIGLMTLAVMSRASLGHTGRNLHAGWALTACYLALILSVFARLAAAVLPAQGWVLDLAAIGWIASFAGFALLFLPVLILPRKGAKRASRAPAA